MLDLVNSLVTCTLGGSNKITVDDKIPNLVATVISVIQFAVPVLLIIWGMLDLGKAVMAQKEDEIKKGQQTFVKRLIAAALVFFVVVVVKLVVGMVGGTDVATGAGSCFDIFVNGVNN